MQSFERSLTPQPITTSLTAALRPLRGASDACPFDCQLRRLGSATTLMTARPHTTARSTHGPRRHSAHDSADSSAAWCPCRGRRAGLWRTALLPHDFADSSAAWRR